MRRNCLLAAGLLLGAAAAQAQSHAEPAQSLPSSGDFHPLVTDSSVDFTMVPRDAGQTEWTISLGGDGKGWYSLKGQPATSIIVSPATFLKIKGGFGAVEAHGCETKQKHIAQTGMKTITYATSPSTPRSCSFNFSDDDGLNTAAAVFQAIAETMQAGERLTHLHRFDRLALDADMDFLVGEIKDGRAIEVQNIAPVLRSLVDDERVIDRVRRKAARLLQDAGVSSPDR